MASARNQLQGMAGLNGSKAGKQVKTPVGFGAVTMLFADMKRHFAGSWFVGIRNQQDLHDRAVQWHHALLRFPQQMIEEAMAEVISRGDVAYPSLDTIAELCQQRIDVERNSGRREAAIKARNAAMAQIRRVSHG